MDMFIIAKTHLIVLKLSSEIIPIDQFCTIDVKFNISTNRIFTFPSHFCCLPFFVIHLQMIFWMNAEANEKKKEKANIL